MHLEIATLSCIGRRPGNEDACGWIEADGRWCCVLSDGAGGHGAGDIAARLAVAATLQSFAAEPVVSGSRVRGLVASAHRAVMVEQGRGGAQGDMRATLVVLLVDAGTGDVSWGHVGDSRVYCIRGDRVVTRTRDHSFLQAMLDCGFVSSNGDAAAPNRNVLTASLGSADAWEPDVLEPPFAAMAGDAFLLCSDGLWDHAGDDAMVAALRDSADAGQWLEHLRSLVERAAAHDQDNYSAIGVKCLA